jgi:hypothetical protein
VREIYEFLSNDWLSIKTALTDFAPLMIIVQFPLPVHDHVQVEKMYHEEATACKLIDELSLNSPLHVLLQSMPTESHTICPLPFVEMVNTYFSINLFAMQLTAFHQFAHSHIHIHGHAPFIPFTIHV